jgi:hypothetical protein
MDIIMPSMDGIAATKEIRKIDKTVVIIAMTSNVKKDDINLYLGNGTFQTRADLCPNPPVGMLDVIGKPFTKPVLQEVLERALPHLVRDGSPRVIGDNDSPTKDSGAWASGSGKTMFSAAGMLSPAPSVNTLVNMTQGGGAMSMWLTEVMSAQEQRAAASQPARATTNGVDKPRGGGGAGQRHDLGPGSGGGQRRNISQISGGASEDRVRVKRQR